MSPCHSTWDPDGVLHLLEILAVLFDLFYQCPVRNSDGHELMVVGVTLHHKSIVLNFVYFVDRRAAL